MVNKIKILKDKLKKLDKIAFENKKKIELKRGKYRLRFILFAPTKE